ncbi:MAG: 23S rRNA (adenine(2503)-C(2))-methyltransferase RlmN [Firmicutes bacterium]|nr:23S rRNA (adenine(2503)-C(2))-methyltransferase RlmN [Bacillota bacterium]
MTLDELVYDFSQFQFKRYKAEQVFKWLYSDIRSFNEMTNLSKDFRSFLDKNYEIVESNVVNRLVSSDGTIKFVLKFSDNSVVESVLMKYKYGNSICISTQVGCKMGCKICANSLSSFFRNLDSSEMYAQISEISKNEGLKISNITLMGIGEPFDNYDNVIKFIKIITSNKGKSLGARKISVSTCGIPEKIKKFADEKLGVTMSVSLHAANDSLRNEILPVNRKFGLAKLIDACRYYNFKTNKRISFEYIMLDKINDSRQDAFMISELLKGLVAHVNLIPMNKIFVRNFSCHRYIEKIKSGICFSELKSSPSEKIHNFAATLLSLGIKVTIRRTLGLDINASCGQLRAVYSL